MGDGRVTLETHGSIAWITIDNQPRRNAMSLAMWEQLLAAANGIGDDMRCVIVRGAGDKAFVSGADISEFAGRRRSPEDVAHYDAVSDAAMHALYSLPQPTVAMISGFCIGGGMALALCCDVRIADETAQFAIPAARLGLGYPATGLKKLLDTVSVSTATDMMVSARRLTAQEALSVGLINRLHPADIFEAEVTHYARSITQNAPLTVRAAKSTIKALALLSAEVDLERCDKLAQACFESDDYKEGVAAFNEKRDPQFQGC